MLSPRALITRLSLRSEYANYALVVAPSVYFILVAGGYNFERGVSFLIGAATGVTVTLFISIGVRLIWLRPLLIKLHDTPSGAVFDQTRSLQLAAPMVRIKGALLRYSVIEGILVMLRWCVGILSAYLVQSALAGINERETMTLLITLAYAAPASGVVVYFTTENALIPVLEDPRLAAFDLPRNRYRLIGMFPRVFITVIVAAAVPVVMLGWLLQLAISGQELNQYLVFHLAAIFSILVYSFAYSARAATASLRKGLQHTYSAVQNMADGDLTTIVPMIGADELGEMSGSMNQIIRRLSETMQGIHENAERLAKFAEEMKSNSGRLRSDTQEQSASIEEISAALEQMGASAERIEAHAGSQASKSESAHQAMERLNELGTQIFQETETSARTADETQSAATNGNKILKDTATQMQKIVESSAEIQDAVAVINDIAEQVSMLALNAAIESARAGEFGRGFAVVADEISKLAEKTQQNSRRIVALVDESSKQVDGGRQYIENTLEAFTAINSNVEATLEKIQSTGRNTSQQVGLSDEVRNLISASADLAQDIASAAREQSSSNREFLESVSKISSSTQSVAEITNRSATMAHELSEDASRLNDRVSFFRFRG
ncbi:MAG: methyl-accepting chemotaxis protein [bacterium]|nr:methyl-accepting chemotaxis protein [bacterium]